MDIRRVLRAGWLILAVSSAIELLTLPGEIQSWQWRAIGIIFVVLALIFILDRTTNSLWSFTPMPATLLALPIIFADSSSEPWIAYGLIIISTVLHTTLIGDYRVALFLIYALVVLQYTVAKLNLPSISDNQDNLLLAGYFSIAWTLIVGIGAIFIRRAYLNYSDAIENSVKKIGEIQLKESAKISELNFKDHLNSQLHGTILNTLMAIKNSPLLLENQNEIAKYLSNDLILLENQPQTLNTFLQELIEAEATSPYLRPLEINFNLDLNSDLEPLIYEVIKELLRELILNIKKHTKATKCEIKIHILNSFVGAEVSSHLIERSISIQVSDNSPAVSQTINDSLILDFRSESIARLLKRVEGEVIQSWDSSRYLQEIQFVIPERYETYLEKIKNLRRESIKYLSKGYIFLSLFFSVITFPAYLYLGIDSKVAAIYLVQILLIAGSFVFKQFEFQLAALGSIIAISIFPLLATTTTLVCQDLQYLPWIFNSLLGSVFYVTLVTKSSLFKWLPILLFLISNLTIQRQLPAGCENLLDGSIPGIFLIFVISVGFAIARSKGKVSDENFIAKATGTYGLIQAAKNLVVSERAYVVNHLQNFVSNINSITIPKDELRKQIDSLILFLRTFLLTSEYFDSPLIYQVYRYSIIRNEKGVSTTLEIVADNFDTGVSPKEIDEVFKRVRELTDGMPATINIRNSEQIIVKILVKSEHEIKPLAFQKANLSIQLLKDS